MVYFLFSKLRGWGKRPAIRPQTQLCGVAIKYYLLPVPSQGAGSLFVVEVSGVEAQYYAKEA